MELKTIVAIINIIYLLNKLADGTLSNYLEWWLGKENIYEEYNEHQTIKTQTKTQTQEPDITSNIMEHITELNKQIAILKEENTNTMNMYCRISDNYLVLLDKMTTLKTYTEKEIQLIKQKTYKNIFEVGKYSPYNDDKQT